MGYPYKRKTPSEVDVKSATFIAGAASLQNLPDVHLPEIAFIGRSNVGKSTLLNRLAQDDKLARTSATPGRTQQLNIFLLKILVLKTKTKHELHLIDLPGFGYAKFSKELREELRHMTAEYLANRDQLRVVCLLVDSRRTPGEDELALRDMIFNSGRHLIVVITKVDELKQNERQKRIAAIAEVFNLTEQDVALAGADIPVAGLWLRILALLT